MKQLAAALLALALIVSICAAQDAQYPWLGSQAGITDEAPEPWTPVEVDGQRVGVWGRAIEWDGGPLPARVTTQDTELLAEPIEHGVTVGGLAVQFPASEQRVTGRTDAAVMLEHSAQAGALTLQTRTLVEFDGFTRITMTLTP